VTDGYITVAGLVAAQDGQGWYDTGDLGYLTETGNVVVLAPGLIPKTPSGKLRRAFALALVN
jgi:hypothetical protein